MTTEQALDALMARVTAGEDLAPDDVRALANSPDILPLGMLADAARRLRHGTRTTYLRVAPMTLDVLDVQVPDAAGEVELTGSPPSVEAAVSAVRRVVALAAGRPVCAFSWADVARLAEGEANVPDVLARLREAGLESLASVALDGPRGVNVAVPALAAAGFRRLRLSVDTASPLERTALFLRAGELQATHECIEALDPLPRTVQALRPTTGYEDVKMVAVARLAAPRVPSIQVDWRRYGPKLAQVALTFGANDVHGISASDEAPEGRRRAPREEIRRNIEAAGFEPVERDGRFAAIA